MSARHDRFFYTGGLRAAGGTQNVRRSARLLSEHLVARDESQKCNKPESGTNRTAFQKNYPRNQSPDLNQVSFITIIYIS